MLRLHGHRHNNIAVTGLVVVVDAATDAAAVHTYYLRY